MFIGKYDRSLDDKGRLVLPTGYRRELEDGGVLAPWDRCIALWSKSTFEGVMDRLLTKLSDGEADDDVVRRFQANAWEVALDGQGRFLIPELHRDHSAITREVSVIGQTNRIEIWNAGRYADLEQGQSPDEVSAEIRRLRIF